MPGAVPGREGSTGCAGSSARRGFTPITALAPRGDAGGAGRAGGVVYVCLHKRLTQGEMTKHGLISSGTCLFGQFVRIKKIKDDVRATQPQPTHNHDLLSYLCTHS